MGGVHALNVAALKQLFRAGGTNGVKLVFVGACYSKRAGQVQAVQCCAVLCGAVQCGHTHCHSGSKSHVLTLPLPLPLTLILASLCPSALRPPPSALRPPLRSGVRGRRCATRGGCAPGLLDPSRSLP
jgi:hypothetical protein